MSLPHATGRDNKYYQYLVTITPTPGFVGEVVVSVGEFDDTEKPTAKEYVPLVKSQRLDATVLHGVSCDTNEAEQVDRRECKNNRMVAKP